MQSTAMMGNSFPSTACAGKKALTNDSVTPINMIHQGDNGALLSD